MGGMGTRCVALLSQVAWRRAGGFLPQDILHHPLHCFDLPSILISLKLFLHKKKRKKTCNMCYCVCDLSSDFCTRHATHHCVTVTCLGQAGLPFFACTWEGLSTRCCRGIWAGLRAHAALHAFACATTHTHTDASTVLATCCCGEVGNIF